MIEVGILRCPVCDKSCLYPVHRIGTREETKQRAASHLEAHRLDESKHGIYRVMMADHLEKAEIEHAADVPIKRWVSDLEELPTLTT